MHTTKGDTFTQLHLEIFFGHFLALAEMSGDLPMLKTLLCRSGECRKENLFGLCDTR